MAQFDPGQPRTLAEIASAFARQSEQGQAFCAAIGPNEFFSAPPGKWSPAQNLRHLKIGNSQVAMALLFPRFTLQLLFGKHLGATRGYEEVVAAYQEILAAGAQAGGSYVPKAQRRPLDPQPVQAKAIKTWAESMRRLSERTGAWTEAAADKYQLPHPLLGKLTLREMLFFTIYHNSHHLKILAERLGKA